MTRRVGCGLQLMRDLLGGANMTALGKAFVLLATVTVVAPPAQGQSVSEAVAMTPKEQAEELMNHGLPLAEKFLTEHGEFFPFGLALTPDVKIQPVAASHESKRPDSQALLALLLDGMRSDARVGKYKAIAVFIDVRVRFPDSGRTTDAVQVGVEHEDAYCADVFVPYSITNGVVEFGNMFAQRRAGTVFGRCQ